jgi:signal transduction histidine kinase
MIYHDLRSPLANIVSSIEMLTMMVDQDPSVLSMLQIATHSTGRVQRLVNSLLDISRLESGQRIIEQKAILASTIIAEALRDTEPSISGRHQTLTTSLPDVPPLLWVDVDMIHRVLINLLENASKFTPTEGRLAMGGTMDGQWFKMWVSDNGPGILPSDRERIFEKFTRVQGKDKVSGLGIGLSFCRLAVQAHGGRIWVESEPGKGTTFWFTLPVSEKVQTGKLLRQTGRLELREPGKNS